MSDFPAPKAQTKHKFKSLKFHEISATLNQNWLIEDIFPSNALSAVYGKPKCGKSFFMLDAALHIALGWSYRGKETQSGAVAYVACEGADGIKRRIEAFRQKYLAEATEAPFHLYATRLNLTAEHMELAESISYDVGTEPVRLVVIDTLNRSLAGSENTDVDMGNYIKAADYLREYFGCAVVLIHHCGHNDKHMRGHTSLAAAVDAQILIRKDGSKITASVELMKDGATGTEIACLLETVEIGSDKNGNPVTSCVISKNKSIEDAVSELLASETPIRTISDKLNIKKNQVEKIKKSLSVRVPHPSIRGDAEIHGSRAG